jgi:hypothetical protein
VDCEFYFDSLFAECCSVQIDAELTLSSWNTVRIRGVKWTREELPPVDDQIPDNGWTACKPYHIAPLVYTYWNDDSVDVYIQNLRFDLDGSGYLSPEDLWAQTDWDIVYPGPFHVPAGGSASFDFAFMYGNWLRFSVQIQVGITLIDSRGQHQSDGPTYVDLASFDAVGREDHIELTWVTATELDNAGFNVRRGLTPDGDRVRVNHEPIAAQGDVLGGGSYAFSDYEVTENVTYYYWLEDVDMHGNVRQHGPVSARLSKRVAKPVKLFLAQNTPNPFSSATDIRFGLPEASAVKLTITDLSGRAVRTLVGGNEPAGYKTVHWDGRNDAGEDVAGGVYFCVLEAGKDRAMTKMVLTK